MIYFANPSSPEVRGGQAILDAMASGKLGMIDTPYQRKPAAVLQGHARGVTWCADNGAFADRWDADTWWAWLQAQQPHASRCRFATAPDVVGDAAATWALSSPWLHRIRALGFPVAYVAQNGMEEQAAEFPWHHIDALFIGGDDAWKLGIAARTLVAEANARGLWTHMGRVNSARRYEYARAIGCDSVDGTYLTFGPAVNLPDVLAWIRNADQLPLF